MQAYDLIMLIVLAATTLFGAIKGFAWQLASLASIVVSYFVAYVFRNDVASMINAQPPWNLFLAMLLLYFGSSFVIWMVFRLVSTSIDKVRLKEFDRHLGAGFGLLKGMLLCILITMFAMTLLGQSQQQRIANSRSGLYISRVLARADGILPSEIKQVVGPYIDNVEQKLQQNQNGLATQGGSVLDNFGQALQNQVTQFGSGLNSQPNEVYPGQGGVQPNNGFGGQGQGGGFSNGNNWQSGWAGGVGQGGLVNSAPLPNNNWNNSNNWNNNPVLPTWDPNSQPPQIPNGWPVSR